MSKVTFKMQERLKSRKEIEAILKSGKRDTSQKIHLHWKEVKPDRKPPVKVLISVPRKKFKRAVDRNLLKRRIREAYRLNKNIVIRHCEKHNKSLNLMFIYYADEVRPYTEIENKIVLLLKGLIPSNEINS